MNGMRFYRWISLALAVALISLALSVTPAGASTTSWLTYQVKAIWAKVNPLVTKVNGINTKVTTQGKQIASLKTRLDALPPTSGFWPIQDIAVSVDCSPKLYPYNSWIFGVDLLAKPVGDQPLVAADSPQQCVVKFTWVGRTYTLYNPTFAITSANAGLAARPDSGTPITIEYWVERYGIEKHGTTTITNWSWP
jgi:hypothetical protein